VITPERELRGLCGVVEPRGGNGCFAVPPYRLHLPRRIREWWNDDRTVSGAAVKAGATGWEGTELAMYSFLGEISGSQRKLEIHSDLRQNLATGHRGSAPIGG
jgi:hypothetical protein